METLKTVGLLMNIIECGTIYIDLTTFYKMKKELWQTQKTITKLNKQ